MSPNTTVRIWWDTQISAYRLMSSYNAALVDVLTKNIPVSDRSYDKATKIWTFVERQLAPLQALLKMLQITPKITTRAEAEQHQQASQARAAGGNPLSTSSPIDLAIIEFVKLMPFDAMLKGYRQAQMQMHPDKGGDPDIASRLNAAWNRVKKEHYKQ